MQNEELKSKIRDMEHANKLALSETQSKMNEAKQANEEIALTRNNLLEKVKMLEQAKTRLMEENENQAEKYRLNLEKEINEVEENHKQEIIDLQARSEEQLTQMKNFYDMEKEKLEKRVTEEKDRANRRLGTV